MGESKTIGTYKGTLRPLNGKGVAGVRADKTISPAKDRVTTTGKTFSKAAGNVTESSTFSKPAETIARPPETEVSFAQPPSRPVVEPVISATHFTPISNDTWLARNGHNLTFAGIFLFTLVLYFRPYELIPALSGFQSIALIIAVATLLVFLPTQFTLEGNFTALPIEVKCALFVTAWALLTIPLAKNPGLAWATFNDTFIKVVLMFIVMVNTLRTKKRITALMWLGIGVGLMLSWQAVDLYQRGEFKTDGYRVSVDFGGMFGNPNDMSIHLVIFIPIAVALGAAAKSWLMKAVFFASAAIMTAGSFVTQSRGAFLGMIAVAAVLVWKFGRRQRFKTTLIACVAGIITILLAPGNYGLRVLSIFIPSLDPVGSSDQRTELLMRSIVVTLRNPLGIGIGNFEIVGTHNLGTHNAFTQVSSELGWLAFAAYMIFLLSPIRKLDLMERQLFAKDDNSWLYYLSIGVQASIAGYFVSSFFSSVAYNWYVYYPVAFAIGLRRIYQLENESGMSEHPNAVIRTDLEAQPA
ncbi:MAG: hypothetical protein HOP17_11520 [Acidobacteria bacterium]|nr:hypothetical protein [Acidobacteriota bacterium]